MLAKWMPPASQTRAAAAVPHARRPRGARRAGCARSERASSAPALRCRRAARGHDPPHVRAHRSTVRVGRARRSPSASRSVSARHSCTPRCTAHWHRRRAGTPEQASVFRLADELHRTSTISDELWQTLAARFDEPQILELIVTAGWYHVIGYVCNGAHVQVEQWARPFPQAGSAQPARAPTA